jgi:hypothetical protein
MLILTAIVFGPTLLLSTAATSMSADQRPQAGLMLLAQATPAPAKPSGDEPKARARGKAPGKAADPAPARTEPVRSRRSGEAPRGRGDVSPPASTGAAPRPTVETSRARNGDRRGDRTDERRAPAEENTGAGTMTRGATGADSPLNNVTPPSRNDRPVRRSDERASGTGDPRRSR